MQEKSLANSYLLLRNMIGFLGIALPIFCFIGGRIWGCQWTQPSLSHYYYSSMHFGFVGTLAVLGFFLVLYRRAGENKRINRMENWLSTIAGIAAIFVGMFPTNISSYYKGDNNECLYVTSPKFQAESWVEAVHLSSAAILFLCFVLLCLFVFPHKRENSMGDKKKQRRNFIYYFCGISIVVVLFSLWLIAKLKSPGYVIDNRLVYWAEFLCLLAFGIAWLVKGSELWVDSKNKMIRGMVQMIR